MKNVIIFGSGEIGKTILKKVQNYFNIVCFLDNNETLQSSKIENIHIVSPTHIMQYNFELIIIGSQKYKEEIRTQLNQELTVSDDKIIYYDDLKNILELVDSIIDLTSTKDKVIKRNIFYRIFNKQFINIVKQRHAMRRVSTLLENSLQHKKLTVDLLQTSFVGGQALEATNRIETYNKGYMDNKKDEIIINFSSSCANDTLTQLISEQIPLFYDKTFPKTLKYCQYNWETGLYDIDNSIYKDFFYNNGDLFKSYVKFQDSKYGKKYKNPSDKLTLPLKKPLLNFSKQQKEKGKTFLSDIVNMKEDDWYVTIYARDDAYYKETQNSRNTFRNADINSFHLAIDEIIKRGGFVIRIGGDVSVPLEYKHEKVFDYSSSNYQDDFLDIFLLAHSKFLIGTPSGYTHVAIPFKTPQLLINCINSFAGFCDLWIPKKIQDSKTKQLISFATFLNRYHQHNNIGEIAENGINQKKFLNVEYIDNSPEEIKEATIEMFKLLEEGKYQTNPSDLKAFHSTWGKWSKPYKNIPPANSFVQKYLQLFKDK